MAVARLSVILFLITYLQVSFGQLVLGNKPGQSLGNLNLNRPLESTQQELQRRAGVVPNFNFNQNLNPGINHNILQQQNNNFDVQQKLNSQQINSQQQLNYQQALNAQQQLNCPQSNSQQLNVQQSLLNQNLQQLQLQQLLQQQQNSIPVTNLKIIPPQPSSPATDISLSSLPVDNRLVSGLPPQVSQGAMLSNLGLTSYVPSWLSNSFSNNQAADQLRTSALLPQNNVTPLSNIPISISQSNGLSLSLSSPLPTSYNTVNNPSPLSPLGVQNLPPSIQIQQCLDGPQNSVSTVQNQPSQSQFTLKSIHLQPLTQMPSQPIITSTQNQPQLSSFSLGQNSSPQFRVNSFTYPTSPTTISSANRGPKSSSLKALLPLLFNLMKEKGSCCGCRSNGCGCANNISNNGNSNAKLPQIFSGYANQINYGKYQTTVQEDESTNTIDSEEFESAENARIRRKHRKHKNRHNDSTELEDEDDLPDYDNGD